MENLHQSSPPLQNEAEIFKQTPQGFKHATLVPLRAVNVSPWTRYTAGVLS